MSENDTNMFTPGGAARRLGISGSALRRLANAYVEVFGELPEAAGGGRLWPKEAVERLERARALMAAGRARSVKDGLQTIEAGDDDPQMISVSSGREVQLLEYIAGRLEGVERLEQEIGQLRREVGELRALPPVAPIVSAPQRLGEVRAFGDGEAAVRKAALSEANERDREDRGGFLVRAARRLERLMGFTDR